MSDVSEFIKITHRELPFSTFDADNHLYENGDALTKFLPPKYEGIVKYVDINGRTKLALRDQISDYIPNPTFGRVAAPGAAGMDPTQGGGGFGNHVGFAREKLVVMPGVDAFFDPEPRLALMKELGIDRTLLWPTLASALEERLADDPDAACAVVHAFNQWMDEHWGYARDDAIFSTPIITLANGAERAIEELQYIHERGAKIFLIRVAPVPTWKGRKSFALPEFDPFWERAQELDIVVGMHSGDSGYHRYTNEWTGMGNTERRIASSADSVNNGGFMALSSEKNSLIDAMASIIGHGLATRFPKLKFMPVEFGSTWIRPFYAKLQRAWDSSPALFDENPVEVFNRNLYIHIFHEPDPQGLIDLGIPVDHLLFGSDFPHPEGMADPLAYAELVQNLPLEDQALIMGGSLENALGVGKYAVAPSAAGGCRDDRRVPALYVSRGARVAREAAGSDVRVDAVGVGERQLLECVLPVGGDVPFGEPSWSSALARRSLFSVRFTIAQRYRLDHAPELTCENVI